VLEADRCEQDAFSPAAIAAAAGSAAAGSAAAPKTFKTDVGRVSARRDEDVANLIEHSETLERVCQEMRGKLVVCEKQVEQLRDRVNAERRKYQDLVSRMENAGGSGAGSSTEAGGGGDSTAALRAALEEQREETRRVREKYEYKLESMEQEVELYAEMMAEMKRAAAANASIGESPAPPRRTGFR
jgi:chromosome segregation ATPase